MPSDSLLIQEITDLRTRLSKAETRIKELEQDGDTDRILALEAKVIEAEAALKDAQDMANSIEEVANKKCAEAERKREEAEKAKAELVMALRDTLRFFDTVAEDQGIMCAGTTMRHARLLVKENEAILPTTQEPKEKP